MSKTSPADSSSAPSILWFRNDLRLADNPALRAACTAGGSVIPVFILDDEAAGSWQPGGAGRWWLHESLTALARTLKEMGSRLVLRRGEAAEQLVARRKQGTLFTQELTLEKVFGNFRKNACV